MPNNRKYFYILLTSALFFLCVFTVSACKDQSSHDRTASQSVSDDPSDSADNSDSVPWNSSPQILLPSADGIITYGNDRVLIDASHTDDGYLMVDYTGSNSKVKLQITCDGQSTYTYDLHGNYEVFPFSSGNGNYSINVYENISGNEYSNAFSKNIKVSLKDPYSPYLYPNQYVNYDSTMNVVALSEALAKDCSNELDVVSKVYNYMIDNIMYDYSKAATVQSGYLPVLDELLSTKRGICFDYAAVMTAMLRMQRIPTRLEIGFAGDTYHAWVSIHSNKYGWINGIIEFDGSEWKLMDPTFAASSSSQDTVDFITDTSNYITKYIY